MTSIDILEHLIQAERAVRESDLTMADADSLVRELRQRGWYVIIEGCTPNYRLMACDDSEEEIAIPSGKVRSDFRRLLATAIRAAARVESRRSRVGE